MFCVFYDTILPPLSIFEHAMQRVCERESCVWCFRIDHLNSHLNVLCIFLVDITATKINFLIESFTTSCYFPSFLFVWHSGDIVCVAGFNRTLSGTTHSMKMNRMNLLLLEYGREFKTWKGNIFEMHNKVICHVWLRIGIWVAVFINTHQQARIRFELMQRRKMIFHTTHTPMRAIVCGWVSPNYKCSYFAFCHAIIVFRLRVINAQLPKCCHLDSIGLK